MKKTIAAFMMLCASPVVAEVPKELAKIQREGQNYYKVDRKVQNAVYSGGGYSVQNVFGILPKNSPASCSHDAAIKIKMIRERMPELRPVVLVYSMKVQNLQFPHAVVAVVNPDGGWWILNNQDMWVDEYEDLKGFRNARFMSLEYAQKLYNGGSK